MPSAAPTANLAQALRLRDPERSCCVTQQIINKWPVFPNRLPNWGTGIVPSTAICDLLEYEAINPPRLERAPRHGSYQSDFTAKLLCSIRCGEDPVWILLIALGEQSRQPAASPRLVSSAAFSADVEQSGI
jgi:hypothetical protein